MAEDYGIKASLKGYDIDLAADHQLLFTSLWPLLKIETQGSYTVTDKTQDIQITTHSLGYPPMFIVFAPLGVNVDSNQNRLQPDFPTCPVMISTTDLVWFGNYSSQGAGSVTLYYYIFRYNMTTDYTASIINTTEASQTIDQNYGVKISKSGSDITSSDLRNFVVHPNARSLQIQKTVHEEEASAPWNETINHALGYEPFFLWYQKTISAGATQNYWQIVGARDQERGGYADTSNVYLNSLATGDYFICIFKDPFTLEE